MLPMSFCVITEIIIFCGCWIYRSIRVEQVKVAAVVQIIYVLPDLLSNNSFN